jgi:class 3 adenylate cyclase
VYANREEARDVVRGFGMQSDEEVDAYIDLMRYGASPGMLEALYRMNRDIDVREVLPTVRVPALVMHGSEDQIVPVEVGRYTAQRLRTARYFEVPGVGHLALGNMRSNPILEELHRFLAEVWQTGGWEDAEPERMLATVLFTDIVDSTTTAIELGDRQWRDLLEQHNALVRRELLRFRGREVDSAGDGFLATFDGPARAIRCASAIVIGAREIGIDVRAGLHTGECEIADGKVAGVAVHTGARVAGQAGGGEVLVSSTVKDLVAGSGIEFAERGAHQLKGIPGEWQLFAVGNAS